MLGKERKCDPRAPETSWGWHTGLGNPLRWVARRGRAEAFTKERPSGKEVEGVRLGLGAKLKHYFPRTLEASEGPGREMSPHFSSSVTAPPMRTHDPHIALQGWGKGTKKDNCHTALQIQKGALLRKLCSHCWGRKSPCAWCWPQSCLHLNILRREKVLAGSGSMCSKDCR